MKHIIQLLLASIIMFGITACHTENDDYYSTVSIILSANDDITIEKMLLYMEKLMISFGLLKMIL